ncbi:MAG: D-aminoacyl-tRNA deacylase [DPANN group archaeon]|nr:D-aminoacyl-tRNA deacylase [DPANN group archaeon]
MKLIVIAKANTASANIGKVLEEKYPELEGNIFGIEENVLDLDRHEKEFRKLKPELIIVASSHKSEAGVPLLTCHTTGNWSADNSRGGLPGKLSIAPALCMRQGILEFQELKAERKVLAKYEIGMEVTHHSPTVDFPVMFVEVGSTEKEWNDKYACEAAADVIYKLATEEPEKVEVAVGFGGGHYCPSFNKKLAGIALGHICPKHHADNLDEEMVLQAYSKTIPKPDYALLEWKGLTGPQKKKITEILEKNKITWKKF